MSNIPQENVVIIGGGPAGLAAAIYAARASLKPLVFAGSPPGGQLTLTSEVENYPGYDSILGTDLVEKLRKQAEKFGTRIINENILEVGFTQKPFQLKISESAYKKYLTLSQLTTDVTGQSISAKAVIIATGAKALWLNIPSEQRLRGKGVSACATCDGFFFRNKTVAVIGGGDTAMEEALTLTKFASKVYLVHRRDSFRASKIMQERVLSHPQIEVIWNAQVEEVIGQMKVEGMKLTAVDSSLQGNNNSRALLLKDKKDVTLDGIFVAIGHKPDTELFKDKISLDAKGYIMTADRAAYEYSRAQLSENKSTPTPDLKTFDFLYSTSTSVSGVFAAGDCVDHVYRQAATAAGMGVEAALDVEKYLELLK